MIGLVLGALAGLALGAFFFGGLWWTVRRAPDHPRPGLLVLGSFLVRSAALVAGLFAVGSGDWARLFVCGAGVIAARPIVLRTLRGRASTAREG